MIELPIRTVNPLNNRRHWRVVWARSKKEREAAYLATPAGLYLPLTVKLTRIGKRDMDSDGLAASFKAIRDGIADKCKVNDGSNLIHFEYAQEKSKTYAVRIEFKLGNK